MDDARLAKARALDTKVRRPFWKSSRVPATTALIVGLAFMAAGGAMHMKTLYLIGGIIVSLVAVVAFVFYSGRLRG